jgi:hypothetical protein
LASIAATHKKVLAKMVAKMVAKTKKQAKQRRDPEDLCDELRGVGKYLGKRNPRFQHCLSSSQKARQHKGGLKYYQWSFFENWFNFACLSKQARGERMTYGGPGMWSTIKPPAANPPPTDEEVEAYVAEIFPKPTPPPQPLPKATSLNFIKNIEASIANTHSKVLQKLSPPPQMPEFLKMEPDVDVTSFCRNIMVHIHATHDLMFSKFDYYKGGHHLERNGWKMFRKIHVKRLKARIWLNKQIAKGKIPESFFFPPLR